MQGQGQGQKTIEKQKLILNTNKIDEKHNKPWILVFSGISYTKKEELCSYKKGFFINNNMLEQLTIKPEDINGGFIETKSNFLRYFSKNQVVYEPLENNNYNICIVLEKHCQIITDNLLTNQSQMENIYKTFLTKSTENENIDINKLLYCVKSFNNAIDIVLNNNKIKERFSTDAQGKLEELKNFFSSKLKQDIKLQKQHKQKQDEQDIKLQKQHKQKQDELNKALKTLNDELNDSWSLIRKYRIGKKIDYVNKIKQGIKKYNKNILKEIVKHTPNGLECCACGYIAPFEVR